MGTKFDNCLTCNEMKAIAARGLCYKCYRAEERSRERATPDRHNPGMRKEHKKNIESVFLNHGRIGRHGMRAG